MIRPPRGWARGIWLPGFTSRFAWGIISVARSGLQSRKADCMLSPEGNPNKAPGERTRESGVCGRRRREVHHVGSFFLPAREPLAAITRQGAGGRRPGGPHRPPRRVRVCRRTLEKLTGATPALLEAVAALPGGGYGEEAALRRVLDGLASDPKGTALYHPHGGSRRAAKACQGRHPGNAAPARSLRGGRSRGTGRHGPGVQGV